MADGEAPRNAGGCFTTWARDGDITLVHVKVGKAKDGAIPFTASTVKQVLELLINRTGYPIYIHDLDGSDVLAMMGAALRKLQGWSESAWSEEMSRYLRQPPPEPEHLVFLRRLLPPTTNTSNNTTTSLVPPSSSSNPTPSKPLPSSSTLPDGIFVPKPSNRVPWLWPQGFPGKKGVHTSMKVVVEHDPTAVAHGHGHGGEEGEGKKVFERGRMGKEGDGNGGVGGNLGNGNGNGVGEATGRTRSVAPGAVGEERSVHGSRSRGGETGEVRGAGARQRKVSGNGSIVGGLGLEKTEEEKQVVQGEEQEGEGEEGDEFDEEDDDEEEDDEDDEGLQVSKTIEALDLGL